MSGSIISANEGTFRVFAAPRPKYRRLAAGAFLASVVCPPEFNFAIGTLVLSPQRLLLGAVTMYLLAAAITSRAALRTVADFLVWAHVVWIFAAIAANHGVEIAVEAGGIYAVECIGAYGLARLVLTTTDDFVAIARMLVGMVAVFAVFTIPEAVWGVHVLRDIFAVFGRVSFDSETRMGLTRALGTFQHPILYGMFASSAFSLAWYCGYRGYGGLVRRISITAWIFLATIASVSTAPLLSVMIQGMAIVWERATRGVPWRWWMLIGLMLGSYVAVDALSNRDPLSVFISYLTFNPNTGYHRMLIWEYGSAEVARHPLFGIGFGDWERPEWLHSPSVDNFWLLTAMRYGILGAVTLVLAVVSAWWGVAKQFASTGSPVALAWMICIVGTCATGVTVHFWGSAFTFFCFLLGAGTALAQSMPAPNRNSKPLPQPAFRAPQTEWPGGYR